MSIMGGFVQGLAGGLSSQIQDKREQFRNSVDTYRQQAQAAYQTYVKTMNEQKAFKRQVENFATQHFGGNVDAARTFLDMHNNDISAANKDILNRGVPEIVNTIAPTLEEQLSDIGIARQEGQLPGQQAELATPAVSDPAQQGVMDHVMSIGKKLFGPVDIADVRSHVAAEMGMSPEELQGIMSGSYLGTDGYTPVQMRQNRLGLDDITNPDAALLKLASMDPESLSPGQRAIQAEARNLIAQKNASRAASGQGAISLLDRLFGVGGEEVEYKPNPRLNANAHRGPSNEEAKLGGTVPPSIADGTIIEKDGAPDLMALRGKWVLAP